MKKRVAVLLTVILMLVMVFPISAQAASLPEPELLRYYWLLSEDDQCGTNAMIVVEWKGVTGADDYKEQYRKNDGPWVDVDETNGFVDTDGEFYSGIFFEEDNASYDVRIAAVDGSTTGDWLYINNIVVPNHDIDPITGFSVTDITHYSITVSWDKINDVDRVLLWINDPDSGYGVGYHLEPSKTSYTYTTSYNGELEPDTEYIISISAEKDYDGGIQNNGGYADVLTSDITVSTEDDSIGDVIDEVIGGQLHRTYYYSYGAVQKEVIYFGTDDSSVIQKINYYEGRPYRISYKLFDESGNLKNLVELYSDGNIKKINYYNTTTGCRYAYKLYDTEGRMTHYIFTYSDGIKPQKTNYYNVNTGERTSYKLYDTQGRTTHLIDCHPGGVKPKKTNYYDVSTGVRKSYKLYDTQGRTTHYAICYSDGIKASKMNYYDVNTGKRTAYKTYRTDGSCSCHVICDSDGNPSVATYYDKNGNVTKVVHY